MSNVSVGKLSELSWDIGQHRPDLVVGFIDKANPKPSELSSLKSPKQIWIKVPDTYGLNPAADEAVAARFLESMSEGQVDHLHLGSTDGNDVAMAAAYVLLCLHSKIGQEKNAAIYLRFTASHGKVNRPFVEYCDRLIQRGGGMVAGLDELLPPNEEIEPGYVNFDLNMLSLSMAS